jgi:hypothetical protein
MSFGRQVGVDYVVIYLNARLFGRVRRRTDAKNGCTKQQLENAGVDTRATRPLKKTH